jgi:hypothetical protein
VPSVVRLGLFHKWCTRTHARTTAINAQFGEPRSFVRYTAAGFQRVFDPCRPGVAICQEPHDDAPPCYRGEKATAHGVRTSYVVHCCTNEPRYVPLAVYPSWSCTIRSYLRVIYMRRHAPLAAAARQLLLPWQGLPSNGYLGGNCMSTLCPLRVSGYAAAVLAPHSHFAAAVVVILSV